MQKRILFVDDDHRFREVVLAFLQGRGLEVVQAASAQEAEWELQIGHFDLLIIDGQLPDFDGVTLIKKIREKGNQTPIIFVSGAWKDTESYRLLAEELKVARILHKPVPPAAMADHIETLLGASLISAKEEKIRGVLEQISARFALDMPEMILDITRDLKLALGNRQPEILMDAGRKVHTLKGSAGSYGFMSMSHAMAELEELLQKLEQSPAQFQDRELQKTVVSQLAGCKALAEHLARSRGKLVDSKEQSTEAVMQILLMAKDQALLKLFESFAASRDDTAVVLCSDRHDLLQSAGMSLCDLVFMEVSQDELGADGEICLALRAMAAYGDVPIVFVANAQLSDADALCHYFGVAEIVRRPLTPEKIMDCLNDLVIMRRASYPKIVMFDDDPNFVRRVEISLNCEGFSVVGFTDTTALDAVLEHAAPSLILSDIDMPGLSGFEVCRHIRANSALKDVPVIMVTARQNWETRLAAYESGADDYLATPVVNAELVVKCRAWIERHRRRSGHEDSLTQLPVHSVFAKQANAYLETASGSVAFVLLRVVNLRAVNEKHGPSAGDHALSELSSLLRRRFRTTALRGRWSASTMALLVRYADKQSFEKSVLQFAQEFRKLVTTPDFQPELSVNVAFAEGLRNVYALAKAAGAS